MVLMFLYWISLLLPYGLGSYPLASLATTVSMASGASILSTDPSMESGELSPRTRPTYGSDSSLEEQRGFYLNFPDEGPDSAALADILSKLVLQAAFNSLVRPASTLEMIELLTTSMWCTMIIMGTLVFGWLFLMLAWQVYWSVHEASKSEPVTLAFLFSIPGLRYLNNHIRYHLFETPLQPRRRFASFVGASAYGSNDKWSLDDLDEFSDHHSSVESNRPRRRRDSSVSMIAAGNTSVGPFGPGEKSQRRRSLMRPSSRDHGRTSSAQSSSSPIPEPSIRKHYSIAGVPKSDDRSLQGPVRSSIGGELGKRTTGSTTGILPEEEEGEFGVIQGSPDKDNNTFVPIIKIDSDDSLPARASGSTSRRSSSVDTEFSLGEASDVSATMVSDDGEASVPLSSSVIATSPVLPRQMSLITPESSPSREPTKSGSSKSDSSRSPRDSGSWRRASVVVDPPVAAAPPVHAYHQHLRQPQFQSQSQSQSHSGSGQQQLQSKLFKRLALPTTSQHHGIGSENAAHATATHQQSELRTEHSKLSRHFTKIPMSSPPMETQSMPSSASTSTIVPSLMAPRSGTIGGSLPYDRINSSSSRDPYAVERLLYEGDLTPPPGFHHRRHSSGHGVPPRTEASVLGSSEMGTLASTTSSATNLRPIQGRPAVNMNEGLVDEDGDMLLAPTTTANSYHAVFPANNSQRRRTSLAASPTKFSGGETVAAPVPSWRSRLRLNSEATPTPSPASTGNGSSGGDPWPSQWRWFTGEPDEREPVPSDQGWASGADNVDVLRAATASLERPQSALSDVYSAAVRPGKLVIPPVGGGSRSSGRGTPEADLPFPHPNRSDYELEVLGGEAGGPLSAIRRRGTIATPMTHQHRINLGIFDDLFSH